MSGGTIKAGTLTTTTGAGSVIIPSGVQFTAKGTMTGHMAPTFCVYRDYNDGGYQSIEIIVLQKHNLMLSIGIPIVILILPQITDLLLQ